MNKKKIIRNILLTFLLLLLFAYVVLCNFLVNAFFVPSFMKKLNVFKEVTAQSYDAQIKTKDIIFNHKAIGEQTNEWLSNLKENESFVLQKVYTDDGYKLIGIEFLPKIKSHKYALILHGYTGWKEEMYPYAKHYVEEGYDTFVPDMRCSGESEGDFIGMGFTDSGDCLKWLNLILQKDPKAKIVIHGQSMGGATALMMSNLKNLPSNVVAIVSEAAYTDAYTMFGEKIIKWLNLPSFPMVDGTCLMLKIRGGYDIKKAAPIEAVKNSKIPIMLIHGDKDDMIPVSMCYKLYDAVVTNKEKYIVNGAGHAQAMDKNPIEFWKHIDTFLKRYAE